MALPPPPGPPAPPTSLFQPPEGVGFAIGVLAGGLVLAHVAYHKLKPWVLAALATRFTRDDARSESTRARILEILAAEGPLELAELSRRAGLSRGGCRHHVRMLERHRLIYDVGVGLRSCYANAATPPAVARRDSALRDPVARRIHRTLAAAGPLGVRAVARGADVSPSVALWHLGKLARADVVKVREEGGRKLYTVPQTAAPSPARSA